MNRTETEDSSYASARNRKLLAEWAAKAGENEYAEPALTRISHTFCDTGAIWSERVSRCKSLSAAGQADPFRQSDFQPPAGRLMDIG